MTFNKRIKSLFEFSNIRIQKLLHLAQHGSITTLISIFFGKILNKYTFELNSNEAYYSILIKTILEITLIIISIYYINKITKAIPFIFRYTKTYNPFHKSKDGENLIGIPVACALVLSVALKNTKDKLSYLVFN